MAAPYCEVIDGSYLSSDTSSVTFTSIPQTYDTLLLRCSIRTTLDTTPGRDYMRMRFNSDSGTNYSLQALYGTDTTESGYAAGVELDRFLIYNSSCDPSNSNIFGSITVEIPAYAHENKNTTIIWQGGTINTNSYPAQMFGGGVWDNTAAVTSIYLAAGDASGQLASGSAFTLYGLKTS
jgi:hypothetical protein